MANPNYQQNSIERLHHHPGQLSDRRIRKHTGRLVLTLAGLIVTHIIAMVVFENLSLWDGTWLTMTTITTVGYGDLSAQTFAGQFSTFLLLYVGGITLLTLIVSDIVDYRIARREKIRTGHWNWNMQDHIVIINSPAHNAIQYFSRLVGQLREHSEFEKTDILLLNTQFPDGLPNELVELGINHVTGTPSQPSAIQRANLELATHIIVLAQDENHIESDAYTFDIAHRLQEMHVGHKTIVEVIDDDNRKRIKDLGIKSIIRPIRSYPEMVVRAMDAPGSELLIEDLFTRASDHPHRYTIWLEGIPWSEIVSALSNNALGTAMAYVTKEGKVVVHPRGDEHITCQSLIVLVKTDDIPSIQEIYDALYPWLKDHKQLTK